MPVASTYELLMNDRFVERLHHGIDSATDRVFIQVMTFDGDAAGLGIEQRLIAAVERGVDVRLTVDLFAFRYVSDTRSTKPAVAGEISETHAMFDRLEAAGIEITYVGPWGPLLVLGALRNHKKIFIVDEMVYLGGINISDHNFEWLDFIVGIGDPDIVSETIDDFHATRRGERVSRSSAIITNERIEDTFDEMISSAKESIVLASPYALDLDLERRLSKATAPSKTVITPQQSNFPMFRRTDPYMRERILRHDVELVTFTDFFHAKFLLVDNTRLLVGSSNFGRHSFRCNQEICVVIEDELFIDALLRALPSTRPIEHRPSKLRYWYGFPVEYYFFIGTNLLERIVVPRAPVLASR